MKRTAGLVALGLGLFLIVIAPLLRWYVSPRVIKVPVDIDSVTVAEASGATYPLVDLENSTVRLHTGTITATRQVVSREKDEGTTSEHLVWEEFLTVRDSDDNVIVDGESTDRVAIDRRTAEAVDCCNPKVNDEPVDNHNGLSYTFPIGTEKKTYDFYDTTLEKSVPIKFTRETKVNGLDVYLFEQTIEPQNYDNREVPGDLVDRPEPSLFVDYYYENLRRVWVEPVTGAIVKGEEVQERTLRDPQSGEELVTVLSADLVWTDDTISKQVKDTKDDKNKALLLTTTLPLITLIAGVFIGAAGFVVSRRRKPEDSEGTDESGGDGGDTPDDEPTEVIPPVDAEDGRPVPQR